jgi:hypothetical protein
MTEDLENRRGRYPDVAMEDQMRQLFENLAVRLEGGPGGADGQQRQEQEAAARLLATEAREKVKR